MTKRAHLVDTTNRIIQSIKDGNMSKTSNLLHALMIMDEDGQDEWLNRIEDETPCKIHIWENFKCTGTITYNGAVKTFGGVVYEDPE